MLVADKCIRMQEQFNDFYKIHFLYQVFIMLYTEDFSMHHYVRFLQIGSHNVFLCIVILPLI